MTCICVRFFFLESFNLWHLLLMIAHYHQIKTPINFLYKQRLIVLLGRFEETSVHLKKGSDNNLCMSIEYNRIKKVRNYQKNLFLLFFLKNKHIHKVEGTRDFILFYFFSLGFGPLTT